MKKLIGRILLFLLTLIIIIAFSYLAYIAPGVTGYAAKNLASGIFLSERSQDGIEKEDLNFSPIFYAKNKVDFERKEVTSRFLLWKKVAVFNEGFGCTLVSDFRREKVKAMKFPAMPEPAYLQDTVAWPAGNIVADTLPGGYDKIRLEQLINESFSDTFPRKGAFGIIVVYRDQIVAEKYRSDFTPNTRMLSWSMAKSVVNALVGIMVREGKISLDDKGLRPEWKNDGRREITLNNLMQMNSGLEWNEDYSTVKLSDVTTMLTKKGDMAAYAAAKKQEAEPAELWKYSSGTTNIVSAYVRSVINDDSIYHIKPYASLFHKIGMQSAVWEPDASGTFTGSSYVYATLRDYARFGLLYLHNGQWLGEQILPENWVEYTTAPAEGSGGEYGAMFWLNKSGKYKGVPEDMFRCQGHNGQRIWIIPSKNLVVAIAGYSPRGTFDDQGFLAGITNLFP